MTHMKNKEHKTAITRTKLSAPMRWLFDNDFLPYTGGLSLDFGCGKGFDCVELGMIGYDPYSDVYHNPCQANKWKIITCNYVLNVIPTLTGRMSVIWDIQNLLTEDGVAYISFRNDKSNLKGETKIGTWQGFTPLNLPVVHKTSGYIIYQLTKNDNLGEIFLCE